MLLQKIRLSFYLLILPVLAQAQYREYFQSDYTQAEQILLEHETTLNQFLPASNKWFYAAIVFPELIRYNYFKNLFETASLKLGYVKYGSHMVDFSIGYCQMKPSFAEKIEQYVMKDTSLLIKYPLLCNYTSSDTIAIRKERIKKLETFNYQLKYLKAFVDILHIKFDCHTWENTEQKLTYYATCYNTGFDAGMEIIQKNTTRKLFPFGARFAHNPFSYAEVALNFYNEKNKP